MIQAAFDGMTFSTELRRLWVAAGDPTLKSVSEAVAARARPAGITVRRSLLARLSDWRNGRHLPREFDGVLLFTIAELLARARERGALDDIQTRMDQWEELWRQERLSEASGQVSCPYPGLAAYGPDSDALFFGRERQIAAIGELVDDAIAEGGGLVALVGVSGSGKSSLLAAGVRPALTERGIRVVSLRPGPEPESELESALTQAEEYESGPLVIVIDQAEELFTVAEGAQVTPFLERLTGLTEPDRSQPVVALVGMRADFVGEWVAYPQLLDAMNRRTYLLGAMRRDELAAVITRPPGTVGVKLDPGLAERILAEFCGPRMEHYDAGALPLLNHALARLWDHRVGNRLTSTSYDDSGGVYGALGETAELTWATLEPGAQDEVKRLLLRLVHLDDSGRDTRTVRTRADLLAGEHDSRANRNEALDALLEARLLTVVDEDDHITFTHEIVMRSWERLRVWIDENRADLLARQQLESAAETWGRAGRDRSLLLRGSQLDRARHAARTGEVTSDSAAFIAAAERAEVRAARVRRAAIFGLVVATVLGLTLSVLTQRARTDAVEQRQAAEIGRLNAEADRLRESDPTMAARLIRLAEEVAPSDAHRSRLVSTGSLPLASQIESGSGAVYTVDVSPDGGRVAGTGSDGAVRIWKIEHPDENPVVLQGHRGFLTAVAWSPDGTKLATTSDDGTARIWTQPGSGRQPLVLRGHRGRVVYAAWDPTGRRLATAGMDGTVRIWDTVTGAQTAELDGHTGDVRTVAWSPDGALVASGGADRTARLWDGRTLAPRGVITGYRDTVHGLEFGPDSRVLATASDDTTVQLWDVGDPAAPRPLGIPITAHTGPVWSVGFSPDGRRLVSASVDGTARVWSIAQPEVPVQLGATLSGAASSLFSATFAPDGRRVVTSGADGRIRIWTLPGTVLAGHVGRVIAPAIAGDRMLTGGSGGTLLSWDLTDQSQPRLLDSGKTVGNARIDQLSLSADGTLSAAATGHSTVEVRTVGPDGQLGRPRVLAVDTLDQQRAVFAPRGSLLLTGAHDDSFQLWRVGPDGESTRLGAPLTHGSAGTWATSAAWSPDGKRLVTAGVDGNVNLWDVSDPARPRRLAESTGGPTAAINALAWSGDVVAAGGDGGVLGFWRVDDGLTFLTERRQQRGGTVRTLDFIDDGKRLVAVGDGQMAIVWNTGNPAAPRQWGEPIGPAGAGRWYGGAHSDGSAAVIGGDHGSLFVVILDPAYAVSRIDAAAPPLSAAERRHFGLG